MSGTRAAVMIAGMACVSAMTIVGSLCGHDGPMVTAGIAAITGICSGVGGYYKGLSDGRKAKDGDTKASSGS